MASETSLPKAALYYYPPSIWCSAVLLTLGEKGYGHDEIDFKVVSLDKGANYDLSFLRINPKATVPTLVVPFANTLTAEVESRYKALTDTKAIVEFLDKSRSAFSRTQTTSDAPAPALAPATIAYNATSNKIIEILHSEEGDPNTLTWLNGKDDAALKAIAQDKLPLLTGKQEALQRYILQSNAGTMQASAKTKAFWAEKLAALEVFLDVYRYADKSGAELDAEQKNKRNEYYQTAKQAWEVDLKDVLINLSKEIIGPFALGDQISVVDPHLGAWLARLVHLSGGSASDSGDVAISKLEANVGNGFVLPKDFAPPESQRQAINGAAKGEAVAKKSKLAAFWDEMRERPSWKTVYGDGLH